MEEDPRIAEVEELLPGANCGGCGLTGCHAFAMACCQATSLQGLNCTGLDAEGMKRIASIVGLDAVAAQKRIAVIRCSASCETRDPLNYYDGVRSCAIESAFYQGETDCIYGCLANGDCAAACPFGAMTIKEGDALPTVDPDKCTGCGKCVEACPRNLVELVPVGGLRQPRPRPGGHEGMRSGMHRLHEMREGMSLRGALDSLFPRPYRPG